MSTAPPTPMPPAVAAVPPAILSVPLDFVDEPIEAAYPTRRFSVDEFWRMVDAEILTEDDRVELLEGIIVVKMTNNPPHASMIDILASLLWRSLPLGWYPRVQHALPSSDSVPDPDIVITRGRPQDYSKRHPGGADVALVIEVADSSLRRDRRKRIIYARAGVIQYWIVDVKARKLEMYAEPDVPAGEYRKREVIELSQAHTFSLPDAGTVTLELGAALASLPD